MKVYGPSVSVPGAQYRKNAAIAPKWFNSLDTNFTFQSCFTAYLFKFVFLKNPKIQFSTLFSGDDENLILMSATSSELESKPGSEMADSTVSMTSWSTEDFSSSSWTDFPAVNVFSCIEIKTEIQKSIFSQNLNSIFVVKVSFSYEADTFLNLHRSKFIESL